jgi:hypothetical protein
VVEVRMGLNDSVDITDPVASLVKRSLECPLVCIGVSEQLVDVFGPVAITSVWVAAGVDENCRLWMVDEELYTTKSIISLSASGSS